MKIGYFVTLLVVILVSGCGFLNMFRSATLEEHQATIDEARRRQANSEFRGHVPN